MATEDKISVRGLCKSFGQLAVLKNVDLSVEPGGVVALLGPSGSGKSTLLRCINLLVQPDGGEVRVGSFHFRFGQKLALPTERQVATFRSSTGMVFQQFNLFPHKTSLQNVMEGPLAVRKASKEEARDLGMSFLEKVGLVDKADEYPSRLSGGQKQRVAIARALAMKPDVMLFDEPTSALDPELVGEVLSVIRALADEGMTMVIVTHEMAFAREVADRAVFMRDGIVVETGAARDLIDAPQTAEARAFVANFHKANFSRGGSEAG